jgi:hypothetical protein
MSSKIFETSYCPSAPPGVGFIQLLPVSTAINRVERDTQLINTDIIACITLASFSGGAVFNFLMEQRMSWVYFTPSN